MKKLLLLLIALPIIALGQEEMVINADDINMVDNVVYFKSDTTLVSGVVRQWHDNGQLRSEEIYKDGKKDGVWKRWNEEGKLISEETYKDGELISKKEY